MNPNNEIKFNFKADLTDLKSGVSEAKQALGELSNFTVNWGEGSGSIEQYQEYLARTNEELQKVAESTSVASESFSSMSDATEQTIAAEATTEQNTSKLSEAFSKLKEKVSETAESLKNGASNAFYNVTGGIEGYITKLKESSNASGMFNVTTRQTRTELLALSASSIAIAKSSWDEYTKSSVTAASTQQSIDQSVRNLKMTIGALLQPVMDIVAGFLQWASENRQLVAQLFAGVAAFAAFGTALWTLSKIASLAVASITSVTGVLGILAGVVAYATVSSMDLSGAMYDNSQQIADIDEQIADLRGQIDDAKNSAVSAGGAATNQLKDIDEQLAKLRRNYLQSLKQIAVSHEQTVADLTRQIEEANVDYQRAVDERNAAFKVSQAEEAEEHQAKVDELMNQINFLQRYNNKYNQEKLEQLKFALAREENLYKQRTAAEAEELRIQNENDAIAHEQKLASLQAELDDELAFQNKHREALNSVREVILLDEIENLQLQEQEQEASLMRQLEQAKVGGYNTGVAYNNKLIEGLESQISELEKEKQKLLNADQIAKESGASAGRTWIENLSYSVEGWLRSGNTIFSKFWNKLGDGIYNIGTAFSETFAGRPEEAAKALKRNATNWTSGWATGGFTGRGDPNEVAGIVHRGEYVLPADMVDQTTGTPKVGATQNIVINVNGTFATSATERRRVAEQIAAALNQTSRARLGA